MSDNRVLLIEEKIDREKTGVIPLGAGTKRGVSFANVGEAMDFSRLMAVSDKAIPAYMRGNVGSCLAIAIQADEWGFSAYAVARMSFVVNDVVCYMSQLIHAVIEKCAPLKQRLRCDFEGEGATRVCIVTGHIIGEVDPLIYRSPQFGSINPKNSPLWKNDPDQQLWYTSSRAWCRRYCPDVLLGAYSKDEMEDSLPPGGATHIGAANAKDITPPSNDGLHQRLSAKAVVGAGFDPAAIAKTLDGDVAPTEPEVQKEHAAEAVIIVAPEVEAIPQKETDGPPKAAAEPKKEPRQSKAPTKTFPNAEAYSAHVAEMCASATTVSGLKDIYNAERAVRSKLHWVTPEMDAQWRAMINAKITELEAKPE